MTDVMNKYNAGIEALQQDARAHGLRKAAEAINLAAIFQARGIAFGENDGVGVAK